MVLPQVFGRIHLIYFPETPGKIGWVVIADFVHDPGYIVLPAIEEHRSLFHPHDAQEVIRGIPCDGADLAEQMAPADVKFTGHRGHGEISIRQMLFNNR